MERGPTRPAAARTHVDTEIWYVTARFPAGPGEEFLGPEIDALRSLANVTIVPLAPATRDQRSAPGVICEHALSRSVILAALSCIVRSPIKTVAAVVRSVFGTSLHNTMRNAAFVPKALWMAQHVPPGAHLHAAWATAPATACMIAAAISGSRWSFSAHRYDITANNKLALKVRSAEFARCIAERGRLELEAIVGTPSASNVYVIHLGVAVPEHFVPRVDDGVIAVLVPASLIPRKNHRTLLEAVAVASATNVVLLLAGDGEERAALVQLACDLGIQDRVDFLGHLSHSELLALYERPDIDVVSLASASEGIPVSLMEALAHGRPVVATDVGGVDELVRSNVGRLVPVPADPSEFVRAWREVSAWSPPVVAEAARHVINADFNADVNASRLADLIGPT